MIRNYDNRKQHQADNIHKIPIPITMACFGNIDLT